LPNGNLFIEQKLTERNGKEMTERIDKEVLFVKLAVAKWNLSVDKKIDAQDPYFRNYLIRILFSELTDTKLDEWITYYSEKVETCPDCQEPITDENQRIGDLGNPEKFGNCVSCYDPTPTN
jgi:hypothetical protein